jgi:CHAD domain-containing protein
MNKSLLVKQISWLIKEYDRQFRLALKGAEEMPVHDLRVMIKRLNSLFLFLDESGIYRKRSTTFFRQLNDFFKSAGYLRDLQVIILIVRNYENNFKVDLQEFDDYLAGKGSSARESFYHCAERYPRQKQAEVKNAIIESVKKISDESLVQSSFSFMIKRLNRIDKFLRSDDASRFLHKIRQTLKQLRYFIEIFQVSSNRSLIDELDYNEIKEIENIIGNWNDRAILIEDIRHFITYNKKLGSGFYLPVLDALELFIKQERKEMVKDIKPRLLKFIYHLKYSIM